jgi:transketolase
MGLEDFAMMRAIEGSSVLYPSDAVSTEHAVRIAAQDKGIVYIRTTRPKTPVIYGANEEFASGRAKIVRSSDDDKVTIVAGGVTLFEALAACDDLKAEGIAVRVIDIFSIKPIDEATLRSSARETNNLVITVEDHSASGGIGEAVAAAVSPVGGKVHVMAVDRLSRSGKPEELMAAHGIDRTAIVKEVKQLVAAS